MKFKKTLVANCPRCNNCGPVQSIKANLTGYKEKIRYYTVCTKCGHNIGIPEKDVPRKHRGWRFFRELK